MIELVIKTNSLDFSDDTLIDSGVMTSYVVFDVYALGERLRTKGLSFGGDPEFMLMQPWSAF